MGIEIRPCAPEEMEEMRRLDRYAFASPEPKEGDDTPDPMQPAWTLCAFVDGRLATSFGSFPFHVNCEGEHLRMAGVTAVASWPEFRRQGLLRQVMTESFVRQRERGRQPFAILWASYAAIYQRFGYGPATSSLRYRIDPREVRFLDPTPAMGAVEVVPAKGAVDEIRPVYDAFGAARPMTIDRTEITWAVRMANDVTQHVGVYRVGGTATGYVIFRIEERDRDRPGPNQRLTVSDLGYADIDALRGIWQFLAAHDLVHEIRTMFTPSDDPLGLLLHEPRMLEATSSDSLWMRVVDVEAALAARPCSADGVLSIAVRDPLCDWNDDTYSIEAVAGEHSVTRTSSSDGADLTLDVHGLAPLLAGHRSATQLAFAGLLDAEPDALATADRFYATAHAPFCADVF